MRSVLETQPLSYFEEENIKCKKDPYVSSEWRPYNLKAIAEWIAIRDKYSFIDSEDEIYKGDWEQLDIRESHSKYGTNYIYIDNDRMLWRIRTTAGEFYDHRPYKRPRPSKIQLEKIYKELYRKKQGLRERLGYYDESISDLKRQLEDLERQVEVLGDKLKY